MRPRILERVGAAFIAVIATSLSTPPSASFAAPQDDASPPIVDEYAAKERLLLSDAANRDLVASDLLKDDAKEARLIVDRGLLPGGSEDVVLSLVKAIAYHRDADHLEALLLLHGTDSREKVRAAVKEALDPMMSPPVELRLFEILRSPDQPLSVQKSAVQFLGRTFDRRIVEGLVDLLSESGTLYDSAPGKNLIGDALARMTPADFGASADGWRRWWAAERSRSDADILLSALRQERQRSALHRRDAVAARRSLLDLWRGRKGEEAAFLAEILATLRTSEYPEVQQHALVRLKELFQATKGRTDTPADVRFSGAIDLVVTLLSQPSLDRAVQIAAIDVLSTLAEPDSRGAEDAPALGERAARAIAAFLPVGQPEEVTLAAVKALGRLRSSFAAGPLLVRLGYGNGNGGAEPAFPVNGHGAAAGANGLREEIVLALGEIGAASAEAALIRVLEARDAETPNVRGNAASALGRIRGEKSAPALAEALANDPDSKVRWRAADALGQIGGPAVEPALIGGLRDGAKEVRKQCATGLGVLKAKAALPALTDLLEDPDEVVREAGVVALGSIGGPVAVGALARRLEDDSDKVALAAQKAFVSALDGASDVLLHETRALSAAGKEKLALDVLRLARESIEAGKATFGAEVVLEIDRAYLDALVASGTDENRLAAIRLAGQIAEEAGAADGAIRAEFRRRQGDLFLEAKDFENAVETFTHLIELESVAGDGAFELKCLLGRASLELGRLNGDAMWMAEAAKLLRDPFPDRVAVAVRDERTRLLAEIRETFVAQVTALFADGIGSAANLSPKWQKFESHTSKPAFIETLLDSARESTDPAYVKSVGRAFRAVAPDAPPLTETASPADREKEIEAIRKFWQRRFPPPRPDRR